MRVATVDESMTTSPTDTVRAAIVATRAMLPAYWTGLVESRTAGHPRATGSVTQHTSTDTLNNALDAATWESFAHPEVAENCTAYRTRDLPGALGLVHLAAVPADAEVRLRDPHATGYVSAEIVGAHGVPVTYSTIILGDHGGTQIVYTFHPGDPVRPSSIRADGMDGRRVSVAECRALGFDLAKVVAA